MESDNTTATAHYFLDEAYTVHTYTLVTQNPDGSFVRKAEFVLENAHWPSGPEPDYAFANNFAKSAYLIHKKRNTIPACTLTQERADWRENVDEMVSTIMNSITQGRTSYSDPESPHLPQLDLFNIGSCRNEQSEQASFMPSLKSIFDSSLPPFVFPSKLDGQDPIADKGSLRDLMSKTEMCAKEPQGEKSSKEVLFKDPTQALESIVNGAASAFAKINKSKNQNSVVVTVTAPPATPPNQNDFPRNSSKLRTRRRRVADSNRLAT